MSEHHDNAASPSGGHVPCPPDGRPGKLSSDEALELAAQVAELAKAGLPLAGGLRALAEELPGGHLSHVLREMSGQLERGATLEAVIEAQGRRLPADVRGLVLAGVRSGRLPEVLEEFVDLQRSQKEFRRRVLSSLAYPLVLLSLLSLLFIFLHFLVVTPMTEIFEDFDAQLPPVTRMFIAASGPGAWIFAAGTALLILAVFLITTGPGVGWVAWLLHAIPLIGPLWRWSRLAQFSRLMAVLLAQEVPLPDALRLTASGLRDGDLARGCRRAAAEVEAGRSITESLASQRQFPPSMIPLVDWGQKTPALADAFHAAAEMFEGRVQSRGTLMETVLVPIMFLMIAAFVLLFVVAMFMPLILIMQKLS